jgi:hypothetical protein
MVSFVTLLTEFPVNDRSEGLIGSCSNPFLSFFFLLEYFICCTVHLLLAHIPRNSMLVAELVVFQDQSEGVSVRSTWSPL